MTVKNETYNTAIQIFLAFVDSKEFVGISFEEDLENDSFYSVEIGFDDYNVHREAKVSGFHDNGDIIVTYPSFEGGYQKTESTSPDLFLMMIEAGHII